MTVCAEIISWVPVRISLSSQFEKLINKLAVSSGMISKTRRIPSGTFMAFSPVFIQSGWVLFVAQAKVTKIMVKIRTIPFKR